MRFVNSSPVQKFTQFVNACLESRKFSFGFITAIALLSVGVTIIQNYIFLKGLPPVPLSPLSASINKPQALGVASDSAELLQNDTLGKEVLVNDTKPPVPVKKTGNKGIGTTEPVNNEKEGPQKEVSITANPARINFPNNKFGIHAYANDNDLELAAKLVNSRGGDWGWITVTMDIHENSLENWNGIFSKMSARHLIPIVQISNNGKIPTNEEIDTISSFLGSLKWPTKIQAVTAFSEVNASEYWGGKIDPEGYARILNRLISQLKQKSLDFFVMNGAFNASARTGSSEIDCIHTDLGIDTCYLSEIEFLKRMNKEVPDIFKKLDGWASHTYPHNAYVGLPTDTMKPGESYFERGRNTIRSYQFELRLLKRDYNITLPVFITETGWPHRDGIIQNKTTQAWLDKDTVASYYRQAFENIFLPDPNVAAVTPFILKRDDFDNFAFISKDGTKFPQWDVLVSIKKTAGNPPR